VWTWLYCFERAPKFNLYKWDTAGAYEREHAQKVHVLVCGGRSSIQC